MGRGVDRRAFLASAPVAAAALAPARSAFAARIASLDEPLARPSRLRPEYTLDEWGVYFNHGSIGTIPLAVQEAHEAYLRTCERNPWLHMWGGAWEEPREATREKAAKLMRCQADEVTLTHNTTEGFNQLAAGLPLGPGDEVLFGSLNHAGASVCWHHHAATRGFTVREFAFPQERAPELTRDEVLEIYADAIAPSTRVLVFPHIDNRVGLRHPMRELAALAHGRGVEFVAVDGAQSLGMIPVNLAGSSVDFFASSPHKWIQSPKGVGVLYVRKAVQESLRPSWVTWGQKRWSGSARVFEDYGTRNLAAILALGDALDFQDALGEAALSRAARALPEARRCDQRHQLALAPPLRGGRLPLRRGPRRPLRAGRLREIVRRARLRLPRLRRAGFRRGARVTQRVQQRGRDRRLRRSIVLARRPT